MSPEQLAGDVLAIDVRTDVYSLGLLLYEILTDRCAFDISGIMLPQALRLLSTTIPQRMRDVAPGRSVELTGDIETIVTKAIERDLSRRYASVAEFAQDLRRYLAHEPISARPPSVVYTARLFARRHRAIVWGVTATMAALVIGIVGTGLLWFVGRGEWAAAAALFVVGSIGFAAANVFYDALLLDVAAEAELDRVSAFGYALGYLGGGLLFALNVLMTVKPAWFMMPYSSMV